MYILLERRKDWQGYGLVGQGYIYMYTWDPWANRGNEQIIRGTVQCSHMPALYWLELPFPRINLGNYSSIFGTHFFNFFKKIFSFYKDYFFIFGWYSLILEIIFPFQIIQLLFVIILPHLESNLKMLKIIPLFLEIFTKLRRCATVMALFRFGDDILLYLLCFLFGVLGHAKETTDYMRWEIFSRLVESKYVQKVGNLYMVQ